MKRDNLFWISYSDIMTGLFFIMLVLFVVAAAFFKQELLEKEVIKKQKEELETARKEELKAVQQNLRFLDEEYFRFDEESKRYRMSVDVRFSPGGSNIRVVSDEVLNRLEEAGRSLYSNIDSLIEANKDVYYLLIIEGNTQRAQYDNDGEQVWNYEDAPNRGYQLSYERALALYNFWVDRGIDFYDFGVQCELIIAGSGYFGLSRQEDKSKNRRFTLQITSKWQIDEGDTIYRQ